MPNPKKYKDQKKFMEDCMHQTTHVEKKDKDQGIAQCMTMWRQRNRKKKSLAGHIRDMAATLEPSHFEPVIQFETKSHYGAPELMYVTSPHQEALQVLTGQKTLSKRHAEALKALGFHLHDIHTKSFL